MLRVRRRVGGRTGDEGLSLAEVVVAAAVLTVGMLAALSATAVGFAGVEAAHRSSVALFLAEERIEQVRAVALAAPVRGRPWLTAQQFPTEPYGTIAGRPGYRRLTEVALEPDGLPDTCRVSVSVFYRPGGGAGPETFERLSTLMTRP